ncbi:uncharacterized protein METZ01_LOCUS328514, partial [marine metagenome]
PDRTQRIIGTKSRQRHHLKPKVTSSFSTNDNILRLSATADNHSNITRITIEFEGFSHPIFIAIVISKTGDQISFVKIDRPYACCLCKVDRNVTRNCRTASISDDNDLAAFIANVHKYLGKFTQLVCRYVTQTNA